MLVTPQKERKIERGRNGGVSFGGCERGFIMIFIEMCCAACNALGLLWLLLLLSRAGKWKPFNWIAENDFSNVYHAECT